MKRVRIGFPILLFMLSVLYISGAFSTGKLAKASEESEDVHPIKAMDWETLQKRLKGDATTSFGHNVARKDLDIYGVKFDTSEIKLSVESKVAGKVERTKINFNEKLGEEENAPGYKLFKDVKPQYRPYRYYLWFENNKQTSNVNEYWHTESYRAFNEELPKTMDSSCSGLLGQGYYFDTQKWSTDPKRKGINVPRYCAVEEDGTLFKSAGKTLDKYALDIYVVDLSDWIIRNWSEGEFSKSCYLQSVTGHYKYGSFYGPFYTSKAWAQSCPWSGSNTYNQHYNYRIDIKNEIQKRLKVHYIRSGSTKNQQKYGNEDKDYGELWVQDNYQPVSDDSALKVVIGDALRKDGYHAQDAVNYYVKGYYLKAAGEDTSTIQSNGINSNKRYANFMIKKNFLSNGGDNFINGRDTTTDYSKMSDAQIKNSLGTQATGKVAERSSLELDVKEDNNSQLEFDFTTKKENVQAKKGDTAISEGTAYTYANLLDYISNQHIKLKTGINDLYVVMEPTTVPNLTIKSQDYTWKNAEDGDGGSFNPTPVMDERALAVKQTKKGELKITGIDDLSIENVCKPFHYLYNVQINYYDKEGNQKTHYKRIDLDGQEASSFNVSMGGTDVPLWGGRNAGTEGNPENIGLERNLYVNGSKKLVKYVNNLAENISKISDIDTEKTIQVVLNYYQPYTIACKVRYLYYKCGSKYYYAPMIRSDVADGFGFSTPTAKLSVSSNLSEQVYYSDSVVNNAVFVMYNNKLVTNTAGKLKNVGGKAIALYKITGKNANGKYTCVKVDKLSDENARGACDELVGGEGTETIKVDGSTIEKCHVSGDFAWRVVTNEANATTFSKKSQYLCWRLRSYYLNNINTNGKGFKGKISQRRSYGVTKAIAKEFYRNAKGYLLGQVTENDDELSVAGAQLLDDNTSNPDYCRIACKIKGFFGAKKTTPVTTKKQVARLAGYTSSKDGISFDHGQDTPGAKYFKLNTSNQKGQIACF